MNTENLSKLATFLDELPEDYRQFGMADFTNQWMSPEELKQYQTDPTYNPCGSAACAVGHAPAAGIKVDPSTITQQILDGYSTDIWDAYVQAAFGIKFDSTAFEFMFGGGWADHDNTPKGAAARIRYVVANNNIPDIPTGWNSREGEPEMGPFDSYNLGYSEVGEITELYEGYLA